MSTSSSIYWPPSAPEPFPPLDQQSQQHQSYHPHHHSPQPPRPQQNQAQSYVLSQHSQPQSQAYQHYPVELEHHFDAIASFSPAFSASNPAYPTRLPQLPAQNAQQGGTRGPAIGVGQGPHTDGQKYLAQTATAIAAGASVPSSAVAPNGAFVFGQNQGLGRGQTSPEEPFIGYQFQSQSAGRGAEGRDGVAPHEHVQTLQSPPSVLPHPTSNADYLQPTGYTPQHTQYAGQGQAPAPKRRRPDEASGSSGWSGSGAGSGGDGEDDDQDDGGYEDFYGGRSDFPGELGQYGTGAGTSAGFNAAYPSVPGQQNFPFDPAASYGALSGDMGVGGVGARGGTHAPGGLGSDGRPKQVHRAACVRCKNLKVRCEFLPNSQLLGDAAVCRRCSNGNHKCEIPGRKKRRQPPKREHLLNQIRDQATEIERMRSMLDGFMKRMSRDEPIRLSISNLQADSDAHPTQPAPRPSVSNGTREPPPEVKAWIEQARRTFEAFGGLVEEGLFAAVSEADQEGDLDTVDESEETDGEGDVSAHEDAGEDGEDWSHVSSPPPTASSISDAGSVSGTSAPPSPAMTVRSASRDGSAAPTLASSSGSSTRGRARRTSGKGASGGRRKTPQPTLPTTTAAPFGMFAELAKTASVGAGAAGGSKSPRVGRSKSMEMDGVVDVEVKTEGDGMGVDGAESGEAEVNVTVESEQLGRGENDADVKKEGPAYGAAAPGFFEPLRRATSLRVRTGSGADASSSADPNSASAGADSNAGAGAGDEGDESGKAGAREGGEVASRTLAPGSVAVPHILARGVVRTHEVEELFEIYFSKMNLSCSLLDPVLYTAKKTYMRSHFLFTVICAIASRYYNSGRPGLYEELITYAQLAAGTALISGPKTVETVAAYILLSLYPLPKARWEEDRTWLYLGLAIRVATDLNLHTTSLTPPKAPNGEETKESERHARERLNRVRVWLNCYNLDRSTASWHGKASTIPSRDYLAAHSERWCSGSEFNLPGFDIQTAAYNSELGKLGEFKESIYGDPENPTGLSKDKDISALASAFDGRLIEQENEWNERLARETDHGKDDQARFRNSLVKLAYRYARLTVLSFGFQQAFRPGGGSGGKEGGKEEERKPFFERCYRAATELVRVFIDELSSQKVYLRHGPEAQCVFVTFASAFLIKLLHPKYAAYLPLEQRREIDSLVRGIMDLLSSPEVAVDDKHSPRLWARFLEGLLGTPMARIELPPPNSPGSKKRPSQKGSSGQKQGRTQNQGQEGEQVASPGMQSVASSSDSASVQQTAASGGSHDALASPSYVQSQSQGQVPIQSHPQSQPQQTSFDMHAQSHDQSQNQGQRGWFMAPQQMSPLQQQHLRGTMPTYATSAQGQSGVGADVGMYGLTSPVSSPLSGDLTSPTLGSVSGSTLGMASPNMSGGDVSTHANVGTGPGTGAPGSNALQMHVPDFYQSPVPLFDSDLLASMQAMQDPSVWQDMPGYNWMSTLQTSDTDATMQDASVFLSSAGTAGSGGMGYGMDGHFATSAGPPF